MNKLFTRVQYLFVVSLTMALLSSCSFMHKRGDGAPNYNVDVSRIPDAVPKHEPLAKYGNMSSYRVFGKRYYPMQSAKNYDQVGVASWYGTKFHARRTSSGERYDMLSMSAAHKTLPLPTYVEVTNLRNQRKIIVKVNDRGPFESNRIIDLSYVAAKKLGMAGRGTAKVRVRALDPDNYNRSTFFAKHESKTPVRAGYPDYVAPMHNTYTNNASSLYLQVGAFKSKSRALLLKQKLAGLVDVPVSIAQPNHRTSLYRVKVGPIRDVAAARKITIRLHDEGIKSNQV